MSRKKEDFFRNIKNPSIFVTRKFCYFEKKQLYLQSRNFFYLAGSYAQLTLLGQPRANSASQSQKTIPPDYQNGRVQYRTQSTNSERPHSFVATNSLQTVSDTKKTKDNHEKLLKQLEVQISTLINDRKFSLCCTGYEKRS